jgi:hypothetical protein
MLRGEPMKTIYSFILATFLLSPAYAHLSGGISDGGGNAVVCRDKDKNIKSAVLLDLVEAEKVLKLPIIKNDPTKTYLQIALEAAARIEAGGSSSFSIPITTIRNASSGETKTYFDLLPGFLKDALTMNLKAINANMNLIPDMGLNPIDDSTTIIKPKDCFIEQTALYVDSTNEIHVSKEIWEAFDDVSKAALLVHEAVYLKMRQAGETTSDRSRLAVGYAFAGKTFTDLREKVPNPTLMCGTTGNSPKYRFAVYERSPGHAVLQFFVVNDKLLFSKMTMDLETEYSPLGKLNIVSIEATKSPDSLMENRTKISWRATRNDKGAPEFAIGVLNSNVLDESIFHTVSCNWTKYECSSDSSCSAGIIEAP